MASQSTPSSSNTIRSIPIELSPSPSLSSLPIPFHPPLETVRHTTKLLKSRDSTTGRLIINQYMKGKELGRGVHGIVYIGKNMDKLIRTSSPYQNPFTSIHSTPLLSSELDHHPSPSHQILDSSPTSNYSIKPNYNPGDPIDENSRWADEDYETVAIKVVRREPKGAKSLKRSQIQRQQERQVHAITTALSNQTQEGHLTGRADSKDSFELPSSGRLPLLKDVDDKLKKEIAIMKRLRHNHIVQLKEVIDDAKSKKVFMILEFMEGGQVLWQNPLTQTPLMTVEQARNTFRQVLLGLEYLHYQGIIHRDIKPANLLWTADRETVKISDFGVSHISGVLKRSASNHNLPANFLPDGLKDDSPRTTNSTDDKALRKTEGSPAFMAPELCCPVEITPAVTPYEANAVDYFTSKRNTGFSKPSNSIDPSNHSPLEQLSSISSRLISLPLPAKTFPPGERLVVGKAIDIWALGVTLFCLLFGRTPFNAPNEYELFNVIWNKPILIPDTMGIERQSLEFHPNNRQLDGPVQRDSRELVDLLGKLLEKDPRKRITLEEVKIHPWVLNNLDNTQYWVHETAPVGGDAVYVTTEEVANFSRPRASLTTHKPLFGVKQSLRKAAIKLGLQRPSPKVSRTKSKSFSSGASGSPSTRVETEFPSSSSRRSSLSPYSTFGHNLTIDTVNAPSNFAQLETVPSLSFASNTSAALKRSLGTCSGWSSNLAPKPNTPRALSVRPVMHSHRPISPAGSTTPVGMRPELPKVKALASTQSCLSSTSSRSGSPFQPNEPSHCSALSVPSSSPSTPLFAPGLHRAIHAHHILLDPIGFSVDKTNFRRSLPNSPASIQAAASLSRSSLVPPRATSPAAVSEGEYHTKLATSTWFRGALFSVRRRFARSPTRRNSHRTNLSASDDLDRHGVNDRERISSSSQTTQVESIRESQAGRFLDELRNRGIGVEGGPPSEVFSSDAEPCSHHDLQIGRERTIDHSAEGVEEEEHGEEVTAEEEDYDDDDDDDDDLGESLLQPPLMYHDGTKWTFPSEEIGANNKERINGDNNWMMNNILNGQVQPKEEQEKPCRIVEGKTAAEWLERDEVDEGVAEGLSGTELTPRNAEPGKAMRTTAATEPQIPYTPYTPTMTTTSSHLIGQSSNHHVPWSHPRLTFRPSSIDGHDERKLEYRSSDDDDEEDDDENSDKFRWKSSASNSSGSGGFTTRELEMDYRIHNQKLTPTTTTSSSLDHLSKLHVDSPSPLVDHHLQNHHQHQRFQPKEDGERDDDDDDEADNTLQIQVKPRKRGCSKSDGS